MASHSWGVGMRSPQQDDKRRFSYLVISLSYKNKTQNEGICYP
jgi:hypothetical protein